MTGGRNHINLQVWFQSKGRREDQDLLREILLSLKEGEIIFSHQRFQGMYWSFYPQYSCKGSDLRRGRSERGRRSIFTDTSILDAKDAFLQAPQEKPLKVILRGKEFLVKRNLPGRRVGAKPWFDFSQSKGIILNYVGDLIFTGRSKSMKSFFQRSKANLTPMWARLRELVKNSVFQKKYTLLDQVSNYVKRGMM